MRHIFVFGSNLAGRHGAGAALFAAQYYGAEYGVGFGLTGNAYALPTKDERLRPLPPDRIEAEYERLGLVVRRWPDWQFLLTPAGAGLAGLPLETVDKWRRRYLFGCRNVWLTGDWQL